MQLRRFKDIVALQVDNNLGQSDYIAFHARNLEVAEISPEAFSKMSQISINSSLVPDAEPTPISESLQALEEWNSEESTEVKSGHITFGIRSVSINVNQICNLKCSYCAAGGDGTYGKASPQISVESTLPQLKFYISKLKPGSKFAVSFIGGEPLLHPHAVLAIYEFIRTECEKFHVIPNMKIVTNGTLLTDETLKIVRSMAIDLTISIDGVKEINDSLRPSKDGKSTTDKIVAALEQLRFDRGKLTSINFSSITCSGNDDIFANYLFLRKFSADSYEFVFANDEKNKTTLSNHIVGLNRILAYAWSLGGETELRKIKSVDHYFRMLDNQQQTENYCGAGKSYMMIDSKNQLYSCVWDANLPSEKIGHGSAIELEKIDKLSKPLIDLNNCRTCWARHLCGGGCMHINRSHNGNKHIKSDIFCERTRNLILATIMYYKQARSID